MSLTKSKIVNKDGVTDETEATWALVEIPIPNECVLNSVSPLDEQKADVCNVCVCVVY